MAAEKPSAESQVRSASSGDAGQEASEEINEWIGRFWRQTEELCGDGAVRVRRGDRRNGGNAVAPAEFVYQLARVDAALGVPDT